MSSITEIREALALSLRGIDGLNVTPVWPDMVNTPVAIVGGPEVQYDDDTQSDHYTFFVHVFTGSHSDAGAQALLDDLSASNGERSVREAINLDPTLSGTVQYATCTNLRNYGVHTVQEQRVFGADFQVSAVAFA